MTAKPTRSSGRLRWSCPWPLVAGAVVLLGILVAFPPFRIVDRGDATRSASTAAADTFEPADVAATFWTEQLQPAAADAPEIEVVLAALRRDPAAAADAHARRVGLGGSAYYFVRGTGRIAAVEANRVLIEIDRATVAVRTGPVFGNAVRDGTGLLDVNNAPGLAEFNVLSAELNRLVEQRVQPALANAAAGATLEFAGVASAPEALPVDGPVLTFVPVQARVMP